MFLGIIDKTEWVALKALTIEDAHKEADNIIKARAAEADQNGREKNLQSIKIIVGEVVAIRHGSW